MSLLFHIMHLRLILVLLVGRHSLITVIILVRFSSLIEILTLVSVPLLLMSMVRRHSLLSHSELWIGHLLKFLERTLSITLIRLVIWLLSEVINLILLSSFSTWIFIVIIFIVLIFDELLILSFSRLILLISGIPCFKIHKLTHKIFLYFLFGLCII